MHASVSVSLPSSQASSSSTTPLPQPFTSARARAAVLIGGVAVVTVFSKVHDAVAAALDRALLVAAVARHEVPIIAALKTALMRLQVGAYDPVATARRDAALGTGVVVGVVPVVTVLAVVHACVATPLEDARVVTGIGRIRVTVITFLVGVDRPITAKGSRYDRVTAAARYHHRQRNPHHTTLHDLLPETRVYRAPLRVTLVFTLRPKQDLRQGTHGQDKGQPS